MGKQAKENAYDASDFFENGQSARPAVVGAVTRADANVPGMPYTLHRTDAEVTADATIPTPITRDLLELGQTRFDTFCTACHGRLGNGEGMIVQRGFTRPPSFHAERLLNERDAHFYNVITHGYGAMLSYRERLSPDERWAIVAYVRALQLAGKDADENTRAAMIARGDRDRPVTPSGAAR